MSDTLHRKKESVFLSERTMAAAAGCPIVVAVVVYLVMVIATRAVTSADMKLIPKGEKLAKLLHIR